MRERRRSARWELEAKEAQFCLPGSDERRQCRLEDLSFGGCRIACRDDLPVGSDVEMIVAFPYLEPIVAEAKVVWGRDEVFNKQRGLRFTKLGDLDREKIFLYVRENHRDELARNWWAGIN
ncbi:MAG: PilZ domain-containing protein [Candidatus Omnitrophica bacterium]|nr:PilZ domain-containing protein [Candidatus Omnitrophota bacterium]